MVINIISIFPEFYDSFLKTSLVKKAISKGVIKINLIDLKDFGVGKYNKVDAPNYSGGPGMVLKPEVVVNALESVVNKNAHNIAITPKGKIFNQDKAKDLSKVEEITIVCGRYEGFDERIFSFVDEKISLGEFITMGGEAPSLCIIESIIRLIPNVIGNIESVKNESHAKKGVLEEPIYTRPEEFRGLKVPEVLLSGDHKKITEWKESKKVVTN